MINQVSSANALTQLYSAISTDAKPTVAVLAFSLIIEEDTGDIYRYSGTTWFLATFGI